MGRRITLDLDDEVAASLDAGVSRTGRSLDATVNARLRRVLSLPRESPDAPAFRVDARDMGLRPGLDLDKVAKLLEQVDGPRYGD